MSCERGRVLREGVKGVTAHMVRVNSKDVQDA